MKNHFLASIVITTFVLMAVFGLYMPGHIGHEAGCPFSPGETAMCASPISHLEHWQSAFAAVLGELLILIFAVVAVVVWSKRFVNRNPQHERYRLYERISLRPLLFQELYSRGILNRKEPHKYAWILTSH
jgi:hypothetical protein